MGFNANDQKLQLMLAALGYRVGTLDGIIGRNTRNAISEFQENNGLYASGDADQDTVDTIYSSFVESSINVTGVILQLMLHYAGYSPGTIDGVIGRNTKKAVESFQEDNDLDATGDWDDDTIQALKEYLYS